ncbi:glycosyltransferase family 4 protein [Leeuwenhoekiella sp.]|uniref:glycosyltransferase family 4 protein n=1 Tax=Leeuwenhoekiella sp. TaxID=1977054 RepID=UPI000C6966D8|nr:glycosyltransferase family 4 protein [Leeuwenhoekiella sp.]MBA82964.1 hypothetical protein [Leeuwenhoekiella sp.]|tara:strand:- start:8543 stop:9592 length:1050 start_codon:yes stop_codon:yes gene_type:complete
MKQIKILYTIPNFKTAGSQYVLLSLLRKIDENVFDPYVCVEKFPESVPEDILEEKRLLFERTGNKIQDILNFRRLLKKNKIAIVHSWDYKSNYLEALTAKLAGVKYVYTKKNNGWSRRWRLKSFFSSHIVYDNPEMKERFFGSLIFKNRLSFIPHGVDTDIFKPITAVPHENFNIVCIGNIGANKNQLFLIEALKYLPSKVVLHLYGKEDKNYRKELDGYIADNNLNSRIFFNGFVDNRDIPEVLSNMDLFVLPSLNEGLPVSILEALSCGVPVLSSDSGGGAKFILEKGGGYLFDLETPESLIKHLKRLVQSPNELASLAKEGRKNIVTNFSIQNELAAYEKLYVKMK